MMGRGVVKSPDQVIERCPSFSLEYCIDSESAFRYNNSRMEAGGSVNGGTGF